MWNDVKRIYDRITFLRQKGVRMKEMAERSATSPSVLSAIYSTVFPAYFSGLEKGKTCDEALEEALIWVNNVSKKKFFNTLAALNETLFTTDFVPKPVLTDGRPPFISLLENGIKETGDKMKRYQGIYLSYSISSSSNSMKIEPYLITQSADGAYIEVGHNNAYGTSHWGVALMNGINHLYLIFNELQAPQLALFQICLKVPMYDNPPFLCGLYTCFDYYYNPIARRILLVKYSDSTDREEFAALKGQLKAFDELDEKEKIYHQYTCRQEDVIRMCNVPSPQMSEHDLLVEKELLAIVNGMKS